MTRGTFYLITNDKFYSSTEFNGDMYPEGHGLTAKRMLDKVESVDDFKRIVKVFNEQEDFNYSEELVYEHPLSTLDKYSDFNYEYFNLQNAFSWFSDWLFIKNISDETYTFTYADSDEKVVLEPGALLIANFGKKPEREDLAYLNGELKNLTLTITVNKSVDAENMVEAMEVVKEKVAQGYTSGSEGDMFWELSEESL